MPWIYLDNNATTQPAPEVLAAMREMHEQYWANPSSVHRFGQMARQRIELARAAVAGLIHCRDRELIFTSGGTEANNLAMWGVLGGVQAGASSDRPRRVLLTTKVEHSAVRQPAEQWARSGVEVSYLPVDRSGRVDPAALAEALDRCSPAAAVLVSVQWANNETGVIQPIAELAEVCRRFLRAAAVESLLRKRLWLHVDATQAVGKIPVNVVEIPVDLLTLSAHKFHGPKGAGALYVRSGLTISPLLRGGPQERERRGGTENTAGIVGMGVAAELAAAFMVDFPAVARGAALRDRFERGILKAVPDALVNGTEPRLWNTSNIAFPHLEAEAILLGLSERGVCASAGAACSSGSLDPSPVLLAMGVSEAAAHGSLRFSLSRFTTEAEIDEALRIVPEVVARLQQTLPIATPR